MDKPVDWQCRLGDLRLRLPDAGGAFLEDPARGSFELTGRAAQQLLGMLWLTRDSLRNVPRPEVERLVDLRMGGSGRRVLVRTVRGNRVRALLSDKYTPMDDAQVLPMLARHLESQAAEVTVETFGGETSHLRIVFPDETIEARPGDGLQAGFHYRNSEVGRVSLSFGWLVYRLVCRNGLILRDGNFRDFWHTGHAERVERFLGERVASLRTGSLRMARRLAASVHDRVLYPEALIQQRGENGNLSPRQVYAVLDSYRAAPDPTVYGVVNAFTHAAQSESTPDGRLRVEGQGALLVG